MTSLKKTVILTPYFGAIDQQHLQSIETLLKVPGWLQYRVGDCALVDHARATLAGLAIEGGKLNPEIDTVLWVDHDIIFQPAEAVAIADAARELDAMVGAPVIIKKPHGPMMVKGLPASVSFGLDGSCVEVDGLPFGFTAMPIAQLRLVCETIGSFAGAGNMAIYPAFSCLTLDGGYMSEDYSFCYRYRELGGKCYLDIRRRVGHKGSYIYTVEDSFYAVPQIDRLNVQQSRGVDGEIPVAQREMSESELAGLVQRHEVD